MEGIADQYIVEKQTDSIIKVIGVGGGGSNAVNQMYKEGIADVSFVVCNTDYQALLNSPVHNKVQFGTGLGAGNRPEVAREAARQSQEEIKRILSDGTKMVFITAGMGGGTGTGAAPVIASIAKEMDILTVGIVTIPFAFEGRKKIKQALDGVAAMRPNVDALLVVQNDKLRTIYPELELSNAFKTADDVLARAAKGIAEIITVEGYINVDFADVSTILRNGGTAVMNTGTADGENRVTKAIQNALNSPLLDNSDINTSKRMLLNFYCSKDDQILMNEVNEINEFMEAMGDDIELIWGINFDDTLGHSVKVTILATGANNEEEQPSEGEKQPQPPFQAADDPNDSLIQQLYPGKFDIPKQEQQLTLELFDDEATLERWEKEPAFKRKQIKTT